MGKLTHPCQDDRLNLTVDCPLKPLLIVWLGYHNLHDAVAGMCLHVVTHCVGKQVARHEHDAVRADRYVPQSRVGNLQQRMQHVLDRLGTLGELVKHDDDGLALVQPEPRVRIVASNPRVMVDDRHCDVTQIHIGNVHVSGYVSRR